MFVVLWYLCLLCVSGCAICWYLVVDISSFVGVVCHGGWLLLVVLGYGIAYFDYFGWVRFVGWFVCRLVFGLIFVV